MEHTMTTTTTPNFAATMDIANLTVQFFPHANAAENWADKHDHFLVTGPSDLEGLSIAQLVAVYNTITALLGPDYQPIKRFSDKTAGATRTWIRLQDLATKTKVTAPAKEAKPKADKARDAAKPATSSDYPAPAKAPKAPRANTGINLEPKATAYPCKEGSKQALLVDLLSREQGATMAELMVAMSGGGKPWQEITVKSGLNWDMNKIKGYGIRTTKRGDSDCYHLVMPKGQTAPHPHTPLKTKKPAAAAQ